MALDSLHMLVDRLAGSPGIRDLRKRRFDAHFANNKGLNLFRGVYRSFEEAAEAIPQSQRAGYDSEQAAELYTDWVDVFDYDYPAMFWLQRTLLEGMRHIFDLGGNVGIKYYAYRKHCLFPEGLRWTVCDLPAVTRKGRELAKARGAEIQLSFVESPQAMAGCDVLFASGSLQYLPQSLPELLAGLAELPRWIVINITPLHSVHDYFTVNSFGPGFSAYRVQRRDSFADSIRRAGYITRAEWKNPGKVLDLPFEPGYGVDHYSGMCFERSTP